MTKQEKQLKVKLVRGVISCTPGQRGTVRGLGLRKVSDESILPDTEATRGMIQKVAHLVEVKSL